MSDDTKTVAIKIDGTPIGHFEVNTSVLEAIKTGTPAAGLEPCSFQLIDDEVLQPGRLFIRRILLTLACVACFIAGFFASNIHPGTLFQEEFAEVSASAIEVDLMYYQGKLHTASAVGCQMTIDEFRRYHGLKAELLSRKTH